MQAHLPPPEVLQKRREIEEQRRCWKIKSKKRPPWNSEFFDADKTLADKLEEQLIPLPPTSIHISRSERNGAFESSRKAAIINRAGSSNLGASLAARKGVGKFVSSMHLGKLRAKERLSAIWRVAAFSDDVKELETCATDKHTQAPKLSLINSRPSRDNGDFGEWGPSKSTLNKLSFVPNICV